MTPRTLLIAALPALLAVSLAGTVGCSSNMSRFDVINSGGGVTSGALQITQSEAADQGSGAAASIVGPGGHELRRVTVGGFYQRQAVRASGPAGHSMTGGLHGKP